VFKNQFNDLPVTNYHLTINNPRQLFKHLLFLLSILVFVSCKSSKEKLQVEIVKGESMLFNDTLLALNPTEARIVLDNYILFADKYKEDTLSAAYLFKAGDLANGMGQPEEAIRIYDRLRLTYPSYRKSSTALFMQGFIFETTLNDKESAKAKYAEFLSKFPDHPLAPSARATLDQLNSNLTDEELIKSFEAKAENNKDL
jgi:tetratricopeptide (TPR) repeat protein